MSVIKEVQQKIDLLRLPKKITVERILLHAGEITSDLKRRLLSPDCRDRDIVLI